MCVSRLVQSVVIFVMLGGVAQIVHGASGLVTVSDGRAITAADITQFDDNWTQPPQHQQALGEAYLWLYERYDAGA